MIPLHVILITIALVLGMLGIMVVFSLIFTIALVPLYRWVLWKVLGVCWVKVTMDNTNVSILKVKMVGNIPCVEFRNQGKFQLHLDGYFHWGDTWTPYIPNYPVWAYKPKDSFERSLYSYIHRELH